MTTVIFLTNSILVGDNFTDHGGNSWIVVREIDYVPEYEDVYSRPVEICLIP